MPGSEEALELHRHEAARPGEQMPAGCDGTTRTWSSGSSTVGRSCCRRLGRTAIQVAGFLAGWAG